MSTANSMVPSRSPTATGATRMSRLLSAMFSRRRLSRRFCGSTARMRASGPRQRAHEDGVGADVGAKIDEVEVGAHDRAQDLELLGIEELRRHHQAALAGVVAEVQAHALAQHGDVDGPAGGRLHQASAASRRNAVPASSWADAGRCRARRPAGGWEDRFQTAASPRARQARCTRVLTLSLSTNWRLPSRTIDGTGRSGVDALAAGMRRGCCRRPHAAALRGPPAEPHMRQTRSRRASPNAAAQNPRFREGCTAPL